MTVELFPFEVTVNQSLTVELGSMRMQWATNHIGAMGSDWICRASQKFAAITYYFKREKDAVMFALRWVK